MHHIRIVFIFLSISLFLFCAYSCTSSNRERIPDEYIEVYYFKGRPDANLSCSKEFSIDEADSLGDITIKSSDYQRIVKYVNDAENVSGESLTCDMFMQCNISGPGKVTRRLCINVFNCTTLDNKQVIVSDSLIYLLRNYSGYYNYIESERLRIFEELEKIGVPPGYKDLSKLDESSNKDFARIIIRPEKYNSGEPE